MKTSSKSRKEKRAESLQDNETQHALWVVRIQEIVAENKSANQALDILDKEVDEWMLERPQWSQAIRLCWSQFLTRINKCKQSR